jgi:hypothetical protein
MAATHLVLSAVELELRQLEKVVENLLGDAVVVAQVLKVEAAGRAEVVHESLVAQHLLRHSDPCTRAAARPLGVP